MNFHNLKQEMDKISQFLTAKEELFLPLLKKKAESLAEIHPYDSTVLGMQNFLAQRSQKAQFISRAELNKVYNNLYSRDNKFVVAFADELGVKIDEVKVVSKTAAVVERKDLMELSKSYGDQFLSNALESLFDKKAVSAKLWDKSLEANALSNCQYVLKNVGLKADLAIVAGNEQALICRAGFPSPKGETAVLIPIEINKDKVLIPNKFANQFGWVELTVDNIKNHLLEHAGKTLNVRADQALASLTKSAEPLNEVELALLKVKLANGTEDYGFSASGIQYKDAFVNYSEVDTKVEIPQEYQDFASQITSKAGEACLLFSNTTVENGRNLVSRAMTNFGYRGAEIGIAGSDKNTVFYAVKIQNKGFKVPVKIANGFPSAPKMCIANSQIEDFSLEGVNSLLNNSNDTDAAVQASPYIDLRGHEVYAHLEKALRVQNWIKAEDALNVLAKHDQDLYSQGYQLYCQALKGETVENTIKCAHIVKDRNHNSPVCSQTGLPLNKVYTDAQGNCRPLHRKGFESGTDQAQFITSRIAWSG